jgi:hypothetical protein
MRCSAYHCAACDVTVQGDFETPALFALDSADAMLAEQFILHSGNLKSLADALNITYPTLRKRLDGLIEALRANQKQNEATMSVILDAMERGTMSAEKGVRKIKELHYES